MSAHDKHEYTKMHKELELRRSEIQELSRTKEKLSARVEEFEQQATFPISFSVKC
jgi:dynactin 1